jgi:hypothetical protein
MLDLIDLESAVRRGEDRWSSYAFNKCLLPWMPDPRSFIYSDPSAVRGVIRDSGIKSCGVIDQRNVCPTFNGATPARLIVKTPVVNGKVYVIQPRKVRL